MSFPKQISDLIEAFERFPGIGSKTAARLTFYLLQVPEAQVQKLGEAVLGLRSGVVFCKICHNISDTEECRVCTDGSRDGGTVCVVETSLDVFSLERSGKFRGVYHVLGGLIDPLHNIGPEELYIDSLISRLAGPQIGEVILALNPTMEGEATSMYIKKKIEERRKDIKLTRLGVGLPIGGDLQYADETTLARAMEGRREY